MQSLDHWGKDPIHPNDGVQPTYGTRQRARVVGKCLSETMLPPTHVVPDGEGGVSFEWRRHETYLEIVIPEEGDIELRVFEDCKKQ